MHVCMYQLLSLLTQKSHPRALQRIEDASSVVVVVVGTQRQKFAPGTCSIDLEFQYLNFKLNFPGIPPQVTSCAVHTSSVVRKT